MSEVIIVRGDRKFVLEFVIYDADNNRVDLTGTSAIQLKFKNYEDGTVTTIPGLVTGDPKEGVVQFQVEDEFVDIIGEFKAEIEITYASGKIITAPNILIKVIPDIR